MVTATRIHLLNGLRMLCASILVFSSVVSAPVTFAEGEEIVPEVEEVGIAEPEGIEEPSDIVTIDEWVSIEETGEEELAEEVVEENGDDGEIIVTNASQLAMYAHQGLIFPNFNEVGEPVSADFDHAFTFVWEDGVEATLPEGLTVSTDEGGPFNLVALGITDVADEVLEDDGFDVSQIEGSTKFGIPGQGLVFSKPVKLQIPAPDVADGEVVFVQVKHGNSEEYTLAWLTNNPDATCENGISSDESNGALVENGMATIYTCGASTFVLLSGGGAGDALMGTDLVEIGINENGVFGADVTSVPSGFHSSREGSFFGFIANPMDDGWVNYDGDFFTPGSEE